MRRFVFLLAFAASAYGTYHYRETLLRKAVPFVASIVEKVSDGTGLNLKGAIPTSGKPDVAKDPGQGRTWTFSDGSQMNAILLSADLKNAQFRVPESQGVGQVSVELLSDEDRGWIRNWIAAEGNEGVAGYPVPLKTHRWPEQWRASEEKVSLAQVGNTVEWRSEHFDITNEARVKREVLESITLICEAVDGALNALPLPLPVNWGRETSQRRKVVIESGKGYEGPGLSAGYWDGQTGMVHINVDALIEPDLQLVVFEFDKPEKVQKYDVIVHEVTHQSTAALMYLGVPAWVSEGLAEYMATTQFAPAYYQFTNTHVSVRHHINKHLLGDRIVKDRRMNVARIEKLMTRDIFEWNRYVDAADVMGFLQYNESLLLIDYFIHRDHPDGVHFRRYLECVLSGVPEPEARDLHLMRGRSYADLEKELYDIWKPLGFTLNYRERSDLLAGDVEIDWNAEDVKRTIATERAMGGSYRGD